MALRHAVAVDHPAALARCSGSRRMPRFACSRCHPGDNRAVSFGLIMIRGFRGGRACIRVLTARVAQKWDLAMTQHELDRPAWTSLVSRHRTHSEGGVTAKRYPPSVVPFAASRDDSPESLEALAALVGPDDSAVLLQADDVRLPVGLHVTARFEGVQMLAQRPMKTFEDRRIERLGWADAEEMLALASLTQPGPFTLRALDIGRFWGIRENGKLVAMAGERMAQSGYVELSGVCSHPDVRGRGLARLLSCYVAGQISERGDAPYLHAIASNEIAIRLYESIGFVVRTEVHIAMIRRAAHGIP